MHSLKEIEEKEVEVVLQSFNKVWLVSLEVGAREISQVLNICNPSRNVFFYNGLDFVFDLRERMPKSLGLRSLYITTAILVWFL